MKITASLVSGIVWASPITIVCFLFYVLPCWVMGWYEYIGWRDNCWLWKVKMQAPEFMHRMWKGWAGHCVGNIVVMVESPDASKRFQIVLVHEQQHVRQCMRLGIVQPILYYANRLAITWACKNSHSYYDNPFEIDARRGAGQYVDYKQR